MLEFQGKHIPISCKELLHPRHTALVVVDVQNDYCEKGGFCEEKGNGLSRGHEIIERLGKLLCKARKAGVFVVYAQNTFLLNHSSESAARLRFLMRIHKLDDPHRLPQIALDGSWGHQIVEDIKPEHNDAVVRKYRPSAFADTNLDMLLRSNNIKTILITGVHTQVCIDSTARDALSRDYFVVVVRDCVDSSSRDLHDASLKIMETLCDIFDSDQVIQTWNMTNKM